MNSNLNRLSSYNVLYVEDDLGIQNNIKEILKHYFKEVFTSDNTKDAYEIYLEKKPDLIITDIRMQSETGIDFIKKIRENDTKTRVIITSAYTNINYLLKATELFLVKYIVKPITIDKLEEALELFLNSYKNESLYYLNKNWIFNSSKSTISNENEEFILTKKESNFLKFLLSQNRVISYEELHDNICDEDSIMSQNAMRLFIKNLRKKLPSNFLKNIQGVGYYYEIKNI
ncbi:response regulator transcription factor [Aliarcobacter skirrowii]|uniref:response regulator transcription factor n=1 Tax=Aliarcobacter skirrowii TaxID=28200 RepID=UPI00082C4C10|nr:response regulator transcription factor [Aliarcobacter skirrowii]